MVLALDHRIKAKDATPGQLLRATVTDEVRAEGALVLRAGAEGEVVVRDTCRRPGFLRQAEGHLSLKAVSVQAVDGSEIPVTFTVPVEKGRPEERTKWTVQDVSVKAGTKLSVEVQANTPISPPR